MVKPLPSFGVPEKIIDHKKELNTKTTIVAHIDGGVTSNWFSVESGVRQGCKLAPDLFLPPMDYLVKKQTVADLDFADGVALLAEILETLVY